MLTTIPAPVDETEAFSGPREMVEITKGLPPAVLNWKPNFSPDTDTILHQGKQVVYRHNVWNLEFSFKPLRMIYVDIPQPSGRMVRKPVWYLVYKVKNMGYHLHPEKGHFEVTGDVGRETLAWKKEPDKYGFEAFGVQRVNHDIRFFPMFVLESHEFRKKYRDQLVPLAVTKIQQREDKALKFYDSVEITQVDIPVSTDRVDKGVWGVATWIDVDPKIDFFSIYVKGLTNAHKFTDTEGAFQVGSKPLTGRRFQNKILQLNFWRPGDSLLEHEGEIRFGLPPEDIRFVRRDDMKAKYEDKPAENYLELYGVQERLDYRWFWE